MPRGGARPGAGRKKKPLAEKILDGNPGKRQLTVLSFENTATDNDATVTVSSPPDFLVAAARGEDDYPGAASIYESVTTWLTGTGCLHLVLPDLISEYALLKARWIECESMNAAMLVSQNEAGKAVPSPFIKIGLDYLRAASSTWARIWDVVSQNCKKPIANTPNDDIMGQLLSGGKR